MSRIDTHLHYLKAQMRQTGEEIRRSKKHGAILGAVAAGAFIGEALIYATAMHLAFPSFTASMDYVKTFSLLGGMGISPFLSPVLAISAVKKGMVDVWNKRDQLGQLQNLHRQLVGVKQTLFLTSRRAA